MEVLAAIARLVVGLIWLAAGSSKLLSGERPTELLAVYGFIPARLENVIGRMLPFLELLMGLALLAGTSASTAASASVIFLGIFNIAIISNLVKGRRIECSCFGPLSRGAISWWSVLGNSALMLGSFAVILIRTDYLTLDGWRRGTALLPTHPPISELSAALLITLASAIVLTIVSSAWQLANTVAHGSAGPALALPERRYLRQWLGLRSE